MGEATMDGKNMKMFASLGSLFVMNQLDFEDKDTEFYVTAIYCFVQVAVFSTYAMLYMRIQKMPDSGTKFTVKAPPLPMGMENPEPDKEMTDKEYDFSKLKEMFTQATIGVGVAFFVYTQWNTPRILFLQGVMAPFTMLENKLIPIHIMGQSAEGDLERPWAPPPGMFDELKKVQAQLSEQNEQPPTAKQKKEDKKNNKQAFIEKKKAEAAKNAEKVD